LFVPAKVGKSKIKLQITKIKNQKSSFGKAQSDERIAKSKEKA
jgi:hypothetical protein